MRHADRIRSRWQPMPEVHDLLRWANRSEVAREITRRGYRVSVETLNRWHRDRKEVPAVVERIVFELFGVSETQKEAAPSMTKRLLAGLIALETRAGISPDELASAEEEAAALLVLEAGVDIQLAAELEAAQRTPDERGRGRAGGRADVSPGSKRQKR